MQFGHKGLARWLRQIKAVEILRQVWIQQFYLDSSGSIQLRKAANCPPSAILINSPYDPDARGGNKRTRALDRIQSSYSAKLVMKMRPT